MTTEQQPNKYVEILKQRIYQQSQRIKELETALNTPITRTTTLSIKRIQDLSKRTKYTKKAFKSLQYWKLNAPYNESLINQNLIAERNKIRNPINTKYIEYKCYNHITSWEYMKQKLWDIYNSRATAFKINLSFGYITENHIDNTVKFVKPLRYYFNTLPVIRSRTDIINVLKDLTTEKIYHFLNNESTDTQRRLIGIYSLRFKIFKLDHIIGAPIKLPDYIGKSKHIVQLDSIENNMCFWSCCALMSGCRRDRSMAKAK
jgi:hypothetical protein